MAATTKYQTYPKYKSSGIDWLGDIPEGWEVKKLKHAVKEFVGGGTPDTGNDQNWTADDNGTPWVNIADMTNAFHIQETEKRITLQGLMEKNLRILPKKTLLYSMYASLGKVALLDIEAVTNQAILGMVENKQKAISNFIKWWLISVESHLSLFSTSSTQNNLNEFKVKNMPFFLPPLPQQKKIADFLDRETAKIDEVVEKKQKLIELLLEKRQAIISQAVTKGLNPKEKMKNSGIGWMGQVPIHWENKKIKRLCLVKRGASPRPIEDPKYFDDEGKYGWVRISDVTASDRYLLDTEQKLSELGKSLSVPLEPGEIFLSIAGSVGKPIITKIKCCIHDGFVYFYNLNFNKEYLYYIFTAGEAYKGLGKLGTQLNLNTDTIGDIFIPVPPKNEQEQIVEYLDKAINTIHSLIKKIELQNQKLQEFRQALISNVVTGKVKV